MLIGVVNFLATYYTDWLHDKMTIFMGIVVIATGSLCANWVYVRPPGSVELTDAQAKFEMWILIEVSLVWGYIFGAAFFMLCSKLTPGDVIEFESKVIS